MEEEYIIEQKSGIAYNTNPIPICVPDSTTTALKKIRAEIAEQCNDICAEKHGCIDEVLAIIVKHLKEFEE